MRCPYPKATLIKFFDYLRWSQEQPTGASVTQEYHNATTTSGEIPLYVAVREDRLCAIKWLAGDYPPTMLFANPRVPININVLNVAGYSPFDECLSRFTDASVAVFARILPLQTDFLPGLGGSVALPTFQVTEVLVSKFVAVADTERVRLEAARGAKAIKEREFRMLRANSRRIIGRKWRILSKQLRPAWFTSIEFRRAFRGLATNKNHWLRASLLSGKDTITRQSSRFDRDNV
ncbi:hypothetical protein N7508_006102 [Penicillium antarcticum]|uniref:uncharacterized protein n=1 Tax=Penicillium antarcticum TaxID=416450 RepID=UPI00239E1406|nr:uncharacterized protein N7508_006102 [Penicillium antarcticum]KAJ5301239.1 hypothetical protein N7508_006102 [Penicillium antarcticum]